MKLETLKKLFLAFCTTLGYLFILIAGGLYLDSYFFADKFHNAQHYANFVMLAAFILLFWQSTNKTRELMIYAVLIGIFGEYLFSLGLSMYTYRLGNVPHYVPFGHAIVYIATLLFSKKPIVKKYRKPIEYIFAVFIIGYSTLFLVFKTDIFGFIMSMAVIYLLRNKPKERLFFLSMYVVVAYLEIVGTNYKCWYWPETAWGVIPFLKSANPPSGISLFYFLLDLGCLWFYKQRNLIAWSRMKNIRRLKLAN